MNVSTIGAVGLAALLITGCETLNSPQAVANAEAQRNTECNTVRLSSASKQLRMNSVNPAARTETPDENSMDETEGRLALGQIRLNEPRALRDPIAPQESLTSKAQREC
ncbi:MAG: hypothetical protein ACHP7B_08390 [Burkholderiales bacterium]